MTKYDKELQSNTDEYDDAMKPEPKDHHEEPRDDRRREHHERTEEDQKSE